jgi:hypothetical protein
MRQLRAASARGHANHGWLDSHHTFSFADYYDEAHLGFRALRVINDDRVAPGMGFGTHPHRDMEIISWVVDGALAHQDSTGGAGVITPGDVQAMRAGTGVRHSEFNGSKTAPVRFLQIWLLPNRQGLPPGYAQRRWSAEEKQGRLVLVAAPGGPEGALDVACDAKLYARRFAKGESATHALAPGRAAWVQVVTGELQVDGQRLTEGDGLAISDEASVTFTGTAQSEVLLFDLG